RSSRRLLVAPRPAPRIGAAAKSCVALDIAFERIGAVDQLVLDVLFRRAGHVRSLGHADAGIALEVVLAAALALGVGLNLVGKTVGRRPLRLLELVERLSALRHGCLLRHSNRAPTSGFRTGPARNKKARLYRSGLLAWRAVEAITRPRLPSARGVRRGRGGGRGRGRHDRGADHDLRLLRPS